MNNLRDKKLLIDFGNNLRELRIRKNLSLEALANEADIEISQVYRMEKGKVNPTLSTLIAVSKALNIEIQELIVL